MFCINQFYEITAPALDEVLCSGKAFLYALAAIPSFNCKSRFLSLSSRVVSTDVFKVIKIGSQSSAQVDCNFSNAIMRSFTGKKAAQSIILMCSWNMALPADCTTFRPRWKETKLNLNVIVPLKECVPNRNFEIDCYSFCWWFWKGAE